MRKKQMNTASGHSRLAMHGPYFVMLAAAVLFLSIYGAASCLENLIEKGRVPRLRGSGGSKAIVRSVLCPGVLVTLVLFVLKTLLT